MERVKTYVLDCETTGITNNPDTGRPDIIELSYFPIPEGTFFFIRNESDDLIVDGLIDYIYGDGIIDDPIYFFERYKPQLGIHKDAFKVHGILYKDLLSCKSHHKSLEAIPADMKYLIGHNAQFDYRCINKPENVLCICTLKLAKKISKYAKIEYENHQLDTLLKYYYPDHAEQFIKQYHDALGDCIKTTLVLIKLLKELPSIKTFEELHHFQEVVK